jgi:hypothetical protein
MHDTITIASRAPQSGWRQYPRIQVSSSSTQTTTGKRVMDATIKREQSTGPLPPMDQIASLVEPAEGAFRDALTKLGPWQLKEKDRVAADQPDSTEHLIEGVRVSLTVAEAATNACVRYEEALEVIADSICQLQIGAQMLGAMPSEDKFEELAHKQAALIQKYNAFHGVVLQMAEQFDELQYRYLQAYGVRQPNGSTEPVIRPC